MRVSEAMTRDVRIATPGQSIRDVARVMAEIDSGAMPVGENDRLIGMITDRDIAVRAVAAGKGPDTPVREVMSPEVKYCYDDEDIEHVAQNMAGIKVRRLPVLNRVKRLVGIVSLGDIALCLRDKKLLSDADRLRYNGPHYYIKSAEEMAARIVDNLAGHDDVVRAVQHLTASQCARGVAQRPRQVRAKPSVRPEVFQRATHDRAIVERRPEVHVAHLERVAAPQAFDRRPRSCVPLSQRTEHDCPGLFGARDEMAGDLDGVPCGGAENLVVSLSRFVDRRAYESRGQRVVDLYQIRSDAVAGAAPNRFCSPRVSP